MYRTVLLHYCSFTNNTVCHSVRQSPSEGVKNTQGNRGGHFFIPRASNSKLYGEADQFIKLDKKKLKEAMAKHEENGENGGDDEKKRKYN